MNEENFTQEHCEQVLGKLATGEEEWACGTHGYIPGRERKPTKGCKDCWLVLYYTIYAKTPADERGYFKDGMEMTLKHMVEHIEHGTWDYKPQRPDIEIIKDSY